MGKYECTQAQYKLVMGSNPSYFRGPERPVERVTWKDSMEFCRRVGLELPTLCQWEYACRAGSKGTYYFPTSQKNDYAWYEANSERSSHPVGQKKPNSFGLYDMIGNVWEWTFPLYTHWPGYGSQALSKGGGWSESLYLFSVKSILYSVGGRRSASKIHGFRCACSI